ncbi:MAG: hypothetical protein U0136_08245 [Bdellovibrionota bacterium]
MSSTLATLELLSVCSDRLSHSLRSPLGVGLSVLDDLAKGMSLSALEIQDGKDSLLRGISIIESLRDIAQPLSFAPKPVALNELIEDELIVHLGKQVVVEHEAELSPVLFADRKLLGRALRLCATYLIAKGSRHNSVSLSWVYDNSSDMTEFVFSTCRGSSSRPRFDDLPPLRELLQSEHSAEIVGLIFAEHVVELHDGEIRKTRQGRTQELRIRLQNTLHHIP